VTSETDPSSFAISSSQRSDYRRAGDERLHRHGVLECESNMSSFSGVNVGSTRRLRSHAEFVPLPAPRTQVGRLLALLCGPEKVLHQHLTRSLDTREFFDLMTGRVEGPKLTRRRFLLQHSTGPSISRSGPRSCHSYLLSRSRMAFPCLLAFMGRVVSDLSSFWSRLHPAVISPLFLVSVYLTCTYYHAIITSSAAISISPDVIARLRTPMPYDLAASSGRELVGE
jgi:hypothetical protein